MNSPYEDVPVERWKEITQTLIDSHPLQLSELGEVALTVWDDIFKSEIGSKPFRIGVDLFPRPQIMAFFLHELIPLELAQRHPGAWRREDTPDEKDIVCVRDPLYSIEIKTSSHTTQIFGNRSYAQETAKAKDC